MSAVLEEIVERVSEANEELTSFYNEQFTLVLNANALDIDDEKYFQFCVDNEDLRIEMNSKGELIIMPPTGGGTGDRNSEINYQLRHWTKQDGTGRCFDSNTEFLLPNGAKYSPDASWIRKDRYEVLPVTKRKKFPPICPDFVIELRSESDRLKPLKQKIEEYIENGASLGLLIDPKHKRVYVYRPQRETEVLENPSVVSCEPELPDFVLDAEEIWRIED
jgi:Uma2 family endonuclease